MGKESHDKLKDSKHLPPAFKILVDFAEERGLFKETSENNRNRITSCVAADRHEKTDRVDCGLKSITSPSEKFVNRLFGFDDVVKISSAQDVRDGLLRCAKMFCHVNMFRVRVGFEVIYNLSLSARPFFHQAQDESNQCVQRSVLSFISRVNHRLCPFPPRLLQSIAGSVKG